MEILFLRLKAEAVALLMEGVLIDTIEPSCFISLPKARQRSNVISASPICGKFSKTHSSSVNKEATSALVAAFFEPLISISPSNFLLP